MLPVKDIIRKARIVLKDEDEEHNSYKDTELLLYVNNAIRYLRRTIKGINPLYLEDVDIQTVLHNGENKYEFDGCISEIINCIVNGKRITEINPFDIKDFNKKGIPEHFYLSNANNTVNFYPTCDKDVDIKISGASLWSELSLEDYSPFSDEMDDFVLEYVVIRAGMSDQFNMSQEMSVMQSIYNQIADIVSIKSVGLPSVKSY